MDVDTSGWRDIGDRLSHSRLSPADAELLVERLTDRLVGHFGTDVVECHLGKNDPTRHSVREVAAACVAHLAEVIDPEALDAVAAAVPPPWDDVWRSDPRTASWRS